MSEKYLNFLKIKEEFFKKGYFDKDTKKTICDYPKEIGLITSDKSAAIVDFLSVINKEISESIKKDIEKKKAIQSFKKFKLQAEDHYKRHPEDIKYHDFRLNEIFDIIEEGTLVKTENLEEGNIPLVVSMSIKDGIARYVKEYDKLFKGHAITINEFADTTVRNYDFFADKGVIVLQNKMLIMNEILLSKKKYNHKNTFKLKDVDKITIKLPAFFSIKDGRYKPDLIATEYLEKKALKRILNAVFNETEK